jgi:2-keto-3-deoxy-6-phosphogluconate aldolase
LKPDGYLTNSVLRAAQLIELFSCNKSKYSNTPALLPDVALIPTCGVTVVATVAFLKAGAAAGAAATSLVSWNILERNNYSPLTECTRKFREEAIKTRQCLSVY